MIPADLSKTIQLILGTFWGIGMIILFLRNKANPKMWPRIFGVGGGSFMFVLSTLGSIPPSPPSELLDSIISNCLWSVVIGILGYFGGRILAHRFGYKD